MPQKSQIWISHSVLRFDFQGWWSWKKEARRIAPTITFESKFELWNGTPIKAIAKAFRKSIKLGFPIWCVDCIKWEIFGLAAHETKHPESHTAAIELFRAKHNFWGRFRFVWRTRSQLHVTLAPNWQRDRRQLDARAKSRVWTSATKLKLAAYSFERKFELRLQRVNDGRILEESAQESESKPTDAGYDCQELVFGRNGASARFGWSSRHFWRSLNGFWPKKGWK